MDALPSCCPAPSGGGRRGLGQALPRGHNGARVSGDETTPWLSVMPQRPPTSLDLLPPQTQ